MNKQCSHSLETKKPEPKSLLSRAIQLQSIMICLIEYFFRQQWHILKKLRCDTKILAPLSNNGRLRFIPVNDTFPIGIDFRWFTQCHHAMSRTTLSKDNFFSRLEFHIEMRSKLSINFVGLSAYKKADYHHQKIQQNLFEMTTNQRAAYISKWCWSAIGEIRSLTLSRARSQCLW